jgi:hypothetical protein
MLDLACALIHHKVNKIPQASPKENTILSVPTQKNEGIQKKDQFLHTSTTSELQLTCLCPCKWLNRGSTYANAEKKKKSAENCLFAIV